MTQDEINAVKKAAEKMRKQESAQDEIIEMWNSVIKYARREVRITEFAKLVAAKEREACAKVCDSFQARDVGMQPAECAGAIRARGEA
jgi:hypothetical protein